MPHSDTVFRGHDKLAFLLAFIPYLVENSPVSVTDAAKHFAVTPEFIRSSVRLIAVSGIPGETGAYQPEDLFDIAWDALDERDEIVLTQLVAVDDTARFSAREAAALISGLHYLSSLPENANRPVIAHLLAKLSRGSSGPPNQVSVAPSATNATLELIRQSVTNGTQIAFDYVTARGDRDRRTVDPLMIESVDRDWYLRAWDYSREAPRTFRLDRMEHVSPTKDLAGGHSTVSSGYLFEPSDDNIIVDIHVAEAALPLIDDWLTSEPQAADQEGIVKATVRVAHFHGLKRMIAKHAGMVTVMHPPEAREAMVSWARDGLSQYE